MLRAAPATCVQPAATNSRSPAPAPAGSPARRIRVPQCYAQLPAKYRNQTSKKRVRPFSFGVCFGARNNRKNVVFDVEIHDFSTVASGSMWTVDPIPNTENSSIEGLC